MKTKTAIAVGSLLLVHTFGIFAQVSPGEASESKATISFIVAECEIPGHGYLKGGNSFNQGSSDFHVIRYDESGTILWNQTYGGDQVDELTTMAPCSDGGFILGGRSNSEISGHKSETPKGEYDFWVIKVDQHGKVEWDRTLGGYEKDDLVDLEQLENGVFVLAGYSDSNSTLFQKTGVDYWVLWLDGTGRVLTEHTYGQKGKDILDSMIPLPDGSLILSGFTKTTKSNRHRVPSYDDYQYTLMKIDPTGRQVWEKNLGTPAQEFFTGATDSMLLEYLAKIKD